MSDIPVRPGSVTAGTRVPDPATTDTRRVRQSGHWVLSAVCATLIPVVVMVMARFTEDGPARMLLTWLIALLMGVTMCAFAMATDAASRRGRSPTSGRSA